MKYDKILRKAGIIIATLVVFGLCVILVNFFYGKSCMSRNIEPYPVDAQEIYFEGREYEYRNNLINILCMGIDKEEQMAIRNDVGNSVGQADAFFLWLLIWNKNKFVLLQIQEILW